ncbi:MAG: hypothetical protein J7K15_13180 [Deltaproteobacteria bacterium]|nr:hypothetical protein [Deltaproteobacteria bacterium]
MNRKTVIGLLIGIVVVAALGVYLAVRPEGPPLDNKAPLRITINSWIGWAPLYLAKDKGLNDGVSCQGTPSFSLMW